MSNPSTELARGAVSALLGAGVREVVLAPGSRNAPLSFAVYDAAGAGALRLHTRIDERSAGYLALGLAKTSGAPVAVICTSGTAVANLHPAVLEAAHADVPLVVVTADRPARLRGTGANQTTDQVDIFGPAARCIDLATWSPPPEFTHLLETRPGPQVLHLNLQFDDPLVESVVGSVESPLKPVESPLRSVESPDVIGRAESGATLLPTGPRTVVVAGDDAGPPARTLAEEANWPLLAEPTSGARTGDNAIRTYRLLLGGELGKRIERVVVHGHPTLSRPVMGLLGRDDVEVWAAPGAGVWPRRPFPVDRTEDRMGIASPEDPGWLEEWRTADRDVGRRLDTLLAQEATLTPYEVAGAVAAALPPEGLLVVGASSPIRDLDLMVPRYDVGARRKVIANRGLSGIDGVVSTAIGAALGRPSSSRCLALVGDVTFLHDSNGLVLGPDEPRPDLTIVVVNDDGGSIFAMLEQGDPAYADRYDRLFGTPHRAELASLCGAFRIPHLRVESIAELRQVLASPNGGIEVVEAVVRRDNRRELDARIRGLVGGDHRAP